MERYLVRRGLNRLILLPIVLSIVYAGVVLWQLDRMLNEREWVMHTTDVISVGMDVQRHFALEESALRGYLLMPSPRFQERFAIEDSIVDRSLQHLHQLIHDNRGQAMRLDSILEAYWTWQASARYSVSHDTTTAAVSSRLEQRLATMEYVREVFARFIDREREFYNDREERFKQVTIILIVTIGILSLALGLIMGLYARRQANLFIRKFGEAVDESSQSRDLLRTTIMSIGDAIIVTDQFRTITLLNLRAEELTGWTMQQAAGRKVDEVFRIVDEATMTPIENPVAAVLKEQRPLELRQRTLLLSRKAVEFPIEDSAAPIRNARRQIVGVVLVFRDVSSRRESERVTEQREREFRALIENAPDVIIRYAPDLTITYVNPAIEHMLGIAPQALLGRRFKDVGIPEEVYFPWERAVQEVFSKQHSISTEIHYQTLHGVRRYQARLVPETSEDGVQSVISISRDITEIKQTEIRLRESESRFRGIIESTPSAFFLFSAIRDNSGAIVDFRFEYLNQKAADLITLPIEQCVGHRLLEVMPGASPERFVARYADILANSKPVLEEYHVTTDYLTRATWLRSLYVPMGETLAITTDDITEQKVTEEALRQSERRYRQLVDSAQEAIFSTDNTGTFTYTNPYIRELSGYSAEEAMKFGFVDLVPDEEKERVRRHFFRQFLSHTPTSSIEAPFLSKDGRKRWLSITTSLRMNGGDIEGFDCIATDVTAHHEREAKLEAAKTRAEQSVQESTVREKTLKHALSPLLESLKQSLSNSSSDPESLREIASRIEHVVSRF